MKLKTLPLLLLTPLLAFAADDKPHAFVGKIERLDPAFDKLVATSAKIEVLAEGFRWSEGPTRFDGGVELSHVLANTAYQRKEAMKQAQASLRPSGLVAAT